MILLDADVLIAFFRDREEEHSKAVELVQGSEERGVITTIILSEIITVIKSRDGGKKSMETWEKIIESDIAVVEIKEGIEQIMYFVEKYDGLSFGDASNIIIMKKFNIEKIISFDSDFDLIPGIERIH
ncbi:PIN domain-containing protein [Candidatus Micrarchaeota archaeon]|nr:PIN domain-containing protein [Candidatus Micrarchaeota archaeon]